MAISAQVTTLALARDSLQDGNAPPGEPLRTSKCRAANAVRIEGAAAQAPDLVGTHDNSDDQQQCPGARRPKRSCAGTRLVFGTRAHGISPKSWLLPEV